MITVAIVGIIASIAFPAFQGLRDRMSLSEATDTLLGHLKQARHLSVSENRSVSVVITASKYTVDSGSGTNNRNIVVPMLRFNNPKLTPSTGTITFATLGKSTSANVVISNNAGCKKIVINVLGRAYIGTPPSPCP